MFSVFILILQLKESSKIVKNTVFFQSMSTYERHLPNKVVPVTGLCYIERNYYIRKLLLKSYDIIYMAVCDYFNLQAFFSSLQQSAEKELLFNRKLIFLKNHLCAWFDICSDLCTLGMNLKTSDSFNNLTH